MGWDPPYTHWTDRKIRIHAFYSLLGIFLLHYVHRQAQAAWADLSVEQLLAELEQIKQFVLLYPPHGETVLKEYWSKPDDDEKRTCLFHPFSEAPGF